ncbi:hypothetical protein DUNSADRAFT_16443 [Dunaliella salina]|uniref:Phosphotyrosine protein phosphatase domain-containing protein n=1 Tax=Dunaliella salina TaxID=3046 RepID=A0ABQ7G3J5_DUNSA|nr:hypothetical protein DUNSADRAFT_16443 [Dunaliella salina]|eukprot:KAF5829178.1 hypothetical protein DUNSADRAFT_16443 [Dunaliella salina]
MKGAAGTATNCPQPTLRHSHLTTVRRRGLVLQGIPTSLQHRRHDARLCPASLMRTSALHATRTAPPEFAEWGSYQDDELGGPPSYAMLHAQHKQQLSVAERQQLAVRLRRALHRLPPGMDPPCPLLIRLFRYAVDDLRLFQAIHAAGMEGTIVVVDDPDEADVLLATPRKRTGKEVPLAEAKRLAETRGLPLVSLRTLSAVRLMKALSPLMGIPVPPHLLPGAQQRLQQPQPLKTTRPDVDASRKVLELLGRGGVGKQQQQQQQQQEGEPQVPAVVTGLHTSPVIMPGSPLWSSTWGTCSSMEGFSGSRNSIDSINGRQGPRVCLPEALSCGTAARFGVRAVQDARATSGGAAAQARLSSRPLLQQLEQHVAADLDDSDVEDSRSGLLPPNPTKHLGPRYPLKRPLMHGSRISRKRAAKKLAEERAPW